MARYAGSTQQTHWLMTAAELADRRANILSTPRPAPFTLAEEAIVLRHHERRILRYATRLKFPPKLPATAITFFKRFFLDHSVLDYNPAVIALSSIYAASKVDEIIISADELIATFDRAVNGVEPGARAAADGTATCVTVDALLRDELTFLNMLRFHLVCFHPYRSLRVIRGLLSASDALTLPVERPSPSPAPPGEPAPPRTLLDNLLDRASHLIARRALFTDLQFTHTHAAMALGAVLCAARGEDGVDARAVEAALVQGLGDGGAEVRGVAGAIAATREGGLASDADVAALEARRTADCDQARDPTSRVYEELRKAKEEESERQRLEEVAAMRVAKKARVDALLGQV